MTNKSRPDSAVSSAVTFSSEAPQEVIAQAVAMALEANNTKHQELFDAALAGRIIEPKGNKTERSLKNEIAVVKAFKKAGFGDVKPHVDVKTFNKWMLDDGLRPAEGSKSIRVAHLRLFHRSQCRPVTAEEKAARQQQSDAAVARHMGKVIPINAEANPQ